MCVMIKSKINTSGSHFIKNKLVPDTCKTFLFIKLFVNEWNKLFNMELTFYGRIVYKYVLFINFIADFHLN